MTLCVSCGSAIHRSQLGGWAHDIPITVGATWQHLARPIGLVRMADPLDKLAWQVSTSSKAAAGLVAALRGTTEEQQ